MSGNSATWLTKKNAANGAAREAERGLRTPCVAYAKRDTGLSHIGDTYSRCWGG